MKTIKELNPFGKFCCTIGNIPTSYMNSLSYEEQLLWFCDFLKNTVIPTVNNNAEAVKELQDLYIQLKEYVDNYFDNLDIQEEINNKLDAMVLDGTLAEIINQEIFTELNNKINSVIAYGEATPAKLHFLTLTANKGECTVIEIEDNNIIADLGSDTEYNTIIGYLVGNSITTIKYLYISHWDSDHAGSYENFVSLLTNPNMDFSECTFILPPVIDWEQTTGLESQQERCEEFTNYLIAEGYTIKYPTEEEVITLDNCNYLKFYNCKQSYLESYYDLLIDDAGNTSSYTAYNNFSLVMELNSCNKSFLFTGDIYENAENNIVNEIKDIDLIKLPHHGLNRYANKKLVQKIEGKIGVVTATENVPPLRPYYQMLLKNGSLYSTRNSQNIIATIHNNEIIMKSSYGAIIPVVNEIKENADLNTIITNGTYILNNEDIISTISNMPTGYSSQLLLKVEEVTASVIYQYGYTLNTNPVIWVRKTTNDGSTWSDWNQLNVHVTNLISATISAAHEFTTTSDEKLAINTQEVIRGNNLSISDGSIVIGDNIKGVKVNVIANFANVVSGDRIMISIKKNNTTIARNDTVIDGNPISLVIPDTLVSVTKNDTISVYVRNNTQVAGKVLATNYNTRINVESI